MLADNGGRAKLLAGGTDLLPKMKRRQMAPEVLVGIGHLDALRQLEVSPSGAPTLGAGTTLSQALRHPALREQQPGYLEAVRVVSTPALRNAGTVGGNLCVDTRCNYYDMTEEWRSAIGFCRKAGGDVCRVATSSPRCWAVSSSDTAPMAIALGATALLAGPDGMREVPVASLYADDGAAYLALAATEVLTALRLPASEGWRSAYQKLRRRASMDFPVASAAVALHLDGPVVDGCRIVLGAVASHPLEVPSAADLLVGGELDDDAIDRAATEAARLAKPLDNTDLSFPWRKRMVKVIVERAVRQAAGRA